MHQLDLAFNVKYSFTSLDNVCNQASTYETHVRALDTHTEIDGTVARVVTDRYERVDILGIQPQCDSVTCVK